MAEHVLMAYNVKWMADLFEGAVPKPAGVTRVQAIADVIKRVNPSVVALSEAANDRAANEGFIAAFLPDSGYKVAAGQSRGRQDLVVYHRPPFEVVSIDDAYGYYDAWTDDVDQDGVEERLRWERRPLEIVFRIGAAGPKFRLIVVHTKSKGIFDVTDLAGFQTISLGNRKKLVAQATKLRTRLDKLLRAGESLIVLGDFNDGPGMDAFERVLGGSFVENVMGSVFEPELVLHNTLAWMTHTTTDRANLWTVDFPDPIVNPQRGVTHKVWIDHILASPDLVRPRGSLRVVRDSGRIAARDAIARKASDHVAVHCKLVTP
jgi:endonuclease/exonuclease/phosphatase family metal-dependent hydrolase